MSKFSFHTNHKLLLTIIGLSFLVLSSLIAVIPAYQVQENNKVSPTTVALNDSELRGKMVYVSEGCQACHTQQVRSNIIDQQWGNRPSIPSDYAANKRLNFWRNTASVLGSERTGPDLTNVGERQPSVLWHMLHLYNPRSVVSESIMPAYPWLFREVEEVKRGEKAINMPEGFGPQGDTKIVATARLNDLIAYLLSLKQTELPDYAKVEFDSYDWQEKTIIADEDNEKQVLDIDGAKMYASKCQVCHQDKGQGVPGAFPALAGSSFANNTDPTEMITTVLFGLDRDNDYGVMPSFKHSLTNEEIAAILSFERSSWGNEGGEVIPEDVKLIRTQGVPSDWPL